MLMVSRPLLGGFTNGKSVEMFLFIKQIFGASTAERTKVASPRMRINQAYPIEHFLKVH